MKKTKIIGALVVLGVVILIVRSFSGSGQQVSLLDSTDTVDKFYGEWLRAAQEPLAADPSLEVLAVSEILSEALRLKIAEARNNLDTNLDPVLCQEALPSDISLRKVYENEEAAQILVTERGNSASSQALVNLERHKEGWFIADIECSAGEFAPEREFSFEQDGFLLKDSIPNPFDSKNWHLVFEQDGVAGNVVPLLFSSRSECTLPAGGTSTCDLGDLTETARVFIQGQMTERGVDIQKLRFVN